MHTIRCSLGVALLFSLTSTASFAFSARGTRSAETPMAKSGGTKGTTAGARFSNSSAPGAVKPTPQQPAPTEVTYARCESTIQGKQIILWLGDYQGKVQSKLSGPGVSDAARDIYAPVQMQIAKSADGKTCEFVASRGGAKSWNFQFPMAQGPSAVQLTMGKSVLACTGIMPGTGAALTSMKACQKPAIMTSANAHPQCKSSDPALDEQAYDCSLTTTYQRKPASRYSIQKCDPKTEDTVCVAQTSCHVKASLPESIASQIVTWPKEYASYVVCSSDLGVCNKTAQACRADKSIYFKNQETAEGQIRMDVGIDHPEAGVATTAPSEESAPNSSTSADVETSVVIKRGTDDGWKMDDNDRPKARVVPPSRGAQ